MTKDPVCLSPGHKAEDALGAMRDGGFRHVPVVEDGRVVGVVSRGDLARCEGAQMNQENGFWEVL
jgi:CBS domain-containing protein